MNCVRSLHENLIGVQVIYICTDEELCGDLDPSGEWRGLEYFCRETVAEARHAALERLRSKRFLDFVVMLDDTVEVTPGWWEGLSKVFSLCPEVGLLSPKLLLEGGTMKRCGRRLLFDGSWEVGVLERTVTRCEAVDSAIYAMRPEIWQNFAFDSQFQHFYDDIDLCSQARAEGWETAATAAVTVNYMGEPTRDKEYLRDPMRRRFLKKWKGGF